MLLYVIDMQDPARYEESFEYLKNILDIMKLMGENPYILAFMHKSDPDIINEPEFQVNCEYVADKLNFLLNKYEFEFDIYTTSIFNFFTSEPKFSKFIKETLSDKESLNNPVIRKVEGLGDILERTLNAIAILSNSLSEQINNLKLRIDELENRLNDSLLSIPKLKTPIIGQVSQTNSIQNQIQPPIMSSSSLYESNTPRQIIYTKKNMNVPKPIRTSSTVDSNIPADDTRYQVLMELQGLFQAKRNLDESNPLNRLGPIGKKFEKGIK